MFVGHLGVGLALRRAEDQVSLGVPFAAVLLLDFLLGLFVWLGVERVIVPDDYSRLRCLRFDFPCSHGLVSSLAWSALASGATAAAVVALAVFSHFPCDALEHPPELPLAGPGSSVVGLGLWNHLGVALGVEAALLAAGLALYLGAGAHPGRPRRLALVVAMVALAALAFGGQALSSAPPSTTAHVVAWLTLPVALGLFGLWIDRPSREA
jgi:hypothetical protein